MGTFALNAVLLALPVLLLSLTAHEFGHAWAALKQGLLPPHPGQQYRGLYPYGMFVLWGLVLTGALRILWPVIAGISNLLLLPSGYQI